MIDKLFVSIVPYDLPVLDEDDIESLKNFIVKLAQCGFKGNIKNENNLRKEMSSLFPTSMMQEDRSVHWADSPHFFVTRSDNP